MLTPSIKSPRNTQPSDAADAELPEGRPARDREQAALEVRLRRLEGPGGVIEVVVAGPDTLESRSNSAP